jgi:hypothetical protein
VSPKRPKVEPMRNPTLFDMEKLEDAAKPASELKVERPYSLPGILLGTSAFTAAGWEGSLYPRGTQPRKAVLAIVEPTELDQPYLSSTLDNLDCKRLASQTNESAG